MQTDSNDLLKPEKAFEWANQARLEKNCSVAAQRWAVLRRAYPDHPATWFQGANAHIEAGELEQAEALVSHSHHQIARMCDRAVLIDDGISFASGEPHEVLSIYEERLETSHL